MGTTCKCAPFVLFCFGILVQAILIQIHVLISIVEYQIKCQNTLVLPLALPLTCYTIFVSLLVISPSATDWFFDGKNHNAAIISHGVCTVPGGAESRPQLEVPRANPV